MGFVRNTLGVDLTGGVELLRSPQQIASIYHLARAMNKASYTLKIIANKIQDTLDT